MSDILGTIVASILDYRMINEGHDRCIPNQSQYAPCDGRSIEGSALAHTLLKLGITDTTAPDLRGKFLRGLNLMYGAGEALFDINSANLEDRSRNWKAGHPQKDSVGNHKHSIIAEYLEASEGSGFNGYGFESNSRNMYKDFYTKEEENLEAETRPKNISVYYYIKIN